MSISSVEALVSQIESTLLPQVRHNIRCAVLYGSRTRNTDQVHPTSDVDFFFVSNQSANPVVVASRAEDFFRSIGLRCDPFWYVDTYFFGVLDVGIDCTLWREIFHSGHIIYAEAELLQRVDRVIRSVSPADSFRRTIIVRQQRHLQHLRALIRNLDRILIDAILLAYCEATGLSTWDAVPDYRSLRGPALAVGAVGEEVVNIHNLLRNLNASIDSVAAGAGASVVRQLPEIQHRLHQFLANLIDQSEI